jgi:hypothetical protein
MKETPNPTVLTGTGYESLVAAVAKILEEGKMNGQQADRSLAMIYWSIAD